METKFNENIFRPNDIRGIYGKDLTDETAEKIGKAFATLIGKKEKCKAEQQELEECFDQRLGFSRLQFSKICNCKIGERKDDR